MTQDYAEGLPVERREDTAAPNEEFTGIVTRLDAAKRESGWDPYEVWRPRVRAPPRAPRVKNDRRRDPRR
jgi:hypothetical protein